MLLKLSVFMLAMLLTVVCFAQGLPGQVPDGDFWVTLINVIKDGKNMGGIVIGGFVLIILIQVLKNDFFGAFFDKLVPGLKQLLIIALGLVYGFIYMLSVSPKLDFAAVMSAVFIGLVAPMKSQGLFEMFKNVFGKKKA